MMRSIFVLALYCILCNLIGFAPTRYEFTCDAYSNGVNTYTDVPGKIIVDSDGNGMTLAIIVSHRVKKKGVPIPFGWWTDSESPSYIRYHSVHPYDSSLHNVYYINSDNDEVCIAVVYRNNIPTEIKIFEQYEDGKNSYILIPYSKSTYDGIYGVINTAKQRINFYKY